MTSKMGPLRRVKLTDLNAHLVCVLCSGYFVDATTIIECLHTFCKTCIVRYLQTSSFCPICDVQVHKTKPLLSLREDRTLQDVVFKLVPDLFHSEMNRRLRFYKEHPEAGGDKTEQSLRERRHFFHVDDQISLSLEYLPSAPTNTSYSHLHGLKPLKISNGQQEKAKVSEDDKEVPGVKKDEGKKEEEKEEEKMPAKVIHKRYLKCPAAVQISHLEKFIRLKYSLTSQTHKVDIMHGGDCLVGELTLLDVVYMYKWTEDAPLRLMYTVSTVPQTRKRARPNGLRTNAATDPEAPAPKIQKTSHPSLLQQQPAHQLTHSEVHPVPGRDQDTVESSKIGVPEEADCSVDEKIVASETNQVTSAATATTTTNAACTSTIGIVSSHMAINIPSLPSTILNSGIARLPTPLQSIRRPAYTKTTPANATPRLAVPTKAYTSTENISTVTAVEGVAVTVQMTTPVVTLTSTAVVTFTSNTTTTTNTVSTKFVPVAPLPVTGVSKPTINGLADSTISQPIMQPIIPTKPRLGRPPNASRIAAMKTSGPRTGDIRAIRPVAPSKVVNKAQGSVSRTTPVVTASLNVQSRLSNISGSKVGNPKVAIKRLSDVPKVVETSENPSKKLAVSTSNLSAANLQTPSSSMSMPQQSTSVTVMSQPNPTTTVTTATIQVSNAPTIKQSQPLSTEAKTVTEESQKPGVPNTQQSGPPVSQSSVVSKAQKTPTVQNPRPQGNQVSKPQQTPVMSAVQPTTKNNSPAVGSRSEHGAGGGNNNKVPGNLVKSPVPSQSTVRTSLSNQVTVSSPSVSVPLSQLSQLSTPTSVTTTPLSSQPKTNQASRILATPSPVRAPNPTSVTLKTPATPASQRSPATTPSRMPFGQTQRSQTSPSPNSTTSSPALHRALSNNSCRPPPSPAPHRVSASPAPHRAPQRPSSSPAPHRAPPSPAPHRAPPSPAPHRAPPSPAPHRAPPSPAPHRAPPSPAPHRVSPSPAPHRAPPSPAPHRAPPSPAPHRAPQSPAPHKAAQSPAPHRAPPSPASQAPPSPASQTPPSPAAQAPPSPSFQPPPSPATSQAASQTPPSPAAQAPPSPSFQPPPSPATSQAPASPAPPTPQSSASQPGQSKSSLVYSKANSQGNLQITSKQSAVPTTAEGKMVTVSSTTSKEMPSVSTNGSIAARAAGSNTGAKVVSCVKPGVVNKAVNTNTVNSCETKLTNSSDAKVASSDAKVTMKLSPNSKATPKSPGRKKGNGGSSTILSIAQNLANRQLHQQRTVNTTALTNTVTTNTNSTPQVSVQQPYSSTQNAIVYPSGGLVAPALAAYMASAYGGDVAMRNLITLSQTAACLREFNLAMVQAAETQAKTNDPAPIDLSPTSKAAPQTPLTNGRSNTISTTSPLSASGSKLTKSAPTKVTTIDDNSAPTISPPTPEVTITKLPNTPATSASSNPTVPSSGKNVPGLVKIASSSTNTVSITKRPISANRIAVAKSPANASVRQIPNPSLLRHQSEVRNNNNVNKTTVTTATTASTKGNTVTMKTQNSPKLNNSGRSMGNSPLKDTGPLPETSSILKIENLTRSLAPAAAAAAAATSPSFRFFDNR
ncbi:uncharacterized protein [Macrobrachium rosenbergii]|uniref:uncharacterized protein n=1 Tax=Macrobrachium rosenbergii TaxID=79674 RepID=UPI0034D3EE5B